MAKMFLLKEFSTEVVEANNLKDYYKFLDCDTIDIVMRKVNETEFDIICDDEGLFKKDNFVSARSSMGEPLLVGNLLFCHHDEEGEMTSVTDEEIELLKSNVLQIIKFEVGKSLSNYMNNMDY